MGSFCRHCGNEINENAVICIKCGCMVQGDELKDTVSVCSDEERRIQQSTIFGIIGIVSAWLFALAGHITSTIGIIKGIKEYKQTEKMTGLILSIIGEVCSIFSSIIGAVTFANLL